MTPVEDNGDVEELLEAYLEAYDEAIVASGIDALGVGAKSLAEMPISRDLEVEVNGLKQCLDLLETARREGTLSNRVGVSAGESHADACDGDVLDTIDQIGPFEIIREVGRGGYGVVLLAFDPRLARHVALKVPRPESLLIAGLRQRFLREARAAAALTHPNIVPVYESGEDGPLCFLAAEFCDGPTLGSWLSQQKRAVPIRDAVRLVISVAEAVHHAHERKVLHRDIKPGNILLDPRGQGDRVVRGAAVGELSDFVPKLTDFGLAKLIEEGATETRSGAILGTPQYMAPEQIEGRRADVGPWTDVYALGVVLYELLAGRPPYDGLNQGDTLRKITSDEAPSLRTWRPDVPRDLEAVVLRCLNRATCRRYESAKSLSADLSRFLDGQATLARPYSSAERIVKAVRRRPALAALMVVCMAAPLLLSVVLAHDNALLNAAIESAQTNEHEAQIARGAAEANERERRREAYPAAMKLAFDVHDSGDLDMMRRLLDQYIPKSGEEDLRGWEWYFLSRIAHTSCRTLRGHVGAVYCASYSPDGTQLASAGADRTIKLWDVSTAKELATLTGHNDEVNSVIYSPDGKLLASASDDGTVRIWDVPSRRETHRIDDHKAAVVNVRFTPAGDQLLSTDRLGTIKIWSTSGWRHLGDLAGHTKSIESLDISLDGRYAVSVDGDHFLRQWNLVDRREIISVENDFTDFPNAVSISPNGRTCVVGTIGKRVGLWRIGEKTPDWNRSDHGARVDTVVFSPDGQTIASAGAEGRIIVHNAISAEVEGTIWAHASRIWCLVYSPDGKTLTSTGGDGTIRLWDMTSSLPRYRRFYSFSPDSRAISADGRRVAVRQSGSPRIAIFDAESGNELMSVTEERYTRSAPIAFTPEGRQLAIACADSVIRFYDLDTRRLSFQFTSVGCDQVMFSHDGARIAVRRNNSAERFLVFDVASKSAIYVDNRQCVLAPDGCHAARLLPTGEFAIEICEVPSGRVVARMPRPSRGVVYNAMFSSAGIVAATSNDGKLLLWKWRSDQPPLVRMIPTFDDCQLSFSPDGTALAATSPNGVLLWNVASGQKLWTMAGATGSSPNMYATNRPFSTGFVPQLVQFTGDGRSLVAWGAADDGRHFFCRWDAATKASNQDTAQQAPK